VDKRAIVIRGGLILFHDGKLLTLDEGLLRRDAQEAASRLDAANDVALKVCRKVRRHVLRGSGVRRSLCAAES
jgi:hypothetical protein